MRAEIEVVQKSISLVAHIHKCRVQAGQHFFDASEINVPDGEIHVAFVLMQLDQSAVFQQCDFHALGGGIDDEFFAQWYEFNGSLSSGNEPESIVQSEPGRAALKPLGWFRLPGELRECCLKKNELAPAQHYFFLWRFLRRRFFRLCVAILWRLRFFPLGMIVVLKISAVDFGFQFLNVFRHLVGDDGVWRERQILLE